MRWLNRLTERQLRAIATIARVVLTAVWVTLIIVTLAMLIVDVAE